MGLLEGRHAREALSNKSLAQAAHKARQITRFSIPDGAFDAFCQIFMYL
jgi:hypothetical protein